MTPIKCVTGRPVSLAGSALPLSSNNVSLPTFFFRVLFFSPPSLVDFEWSYCAGVDCWPKGAIAGLF